MLTNLSDSLAAIKLKEAIPLTILTGFLGAGKTTLLNHILTGDHGRRVAVLVNDFGSVNIDASLVVGIEENMVSLANGCICCEIRDDLLECVERLISSEELPEHILLEASGIADPSSIWATFASSRHPDWLRLDGVICVVDCEQLFAHLDEAPELLMLKARQIGFADLVILNKTDLVSGEVVDYVRCWIDAMMNRVRMVEATHCQVPLEVLLGLCRDPISAFWSSGDPPLPQHGLAQQHQFASWSFQTDQTFDENALRDMISKRLPASIYRCKGFVRLAGEQDSIRVLQVVGRRTELLPTSIEAIGDASTIIAIGNRQTDAHQVIKEFQSCLV